MSGRSAVIGLLLALMFATVVAAPRLGLYAAQTTPAAESADPTPVPPPTAAVRARVIGRVDLNTLPSEPAVLSIVALSLAPGASTGSFTNAGPVLFVVERGVVTLDAATAVVGLPPSAAAEIIGVPVAAPSPAPAKDLVVAERSQILIPAEIGVQLTNTTDEPADLLVVTLLPAAADQLVATQSS